MVTGRKKSGKKVGSKKSYRISGKEGFKRSHVEKARNDARAASRSVFRFWIPSGDSKEIILLDKEPEFIYEHNLQDPKTNRWDRFYTCPRGMDVCPVCDAINESYYAMIFTVIDLTDYKDKAGNSHLFSRKLLVVKTAQHGIFERLYERQAKAGKTLRGVKLECTRDSDNHARIGNDIQKVEDVPERELARYKKKFQKQGKTVTEDCSQPYDYSVIIPAPDMKLLQNIAGSGPIPGSDDEADTALQGTDDIDGWDDEDSDGSETEYETAKPSVRKVSSKKRRSKKKVSRRSATARKVSSRKKVARKKKARRRSAL